MLKDRFVRRLGWQTSIGLLILSEVQADYCGREQEIMECNG